MTGPKHLWSGDWRPESAAAAQELAERRKRTDAPTEPPPPEAPPARPIREFFARLVAGVRSARRPRAPRGVLIALATMVSAVLAYALVSALVSPGSDRSSQTTSSHNQPVPAASAGAAYLGVQTTSVPLFSGAMVMEVAPGSPADAAGLEPGDVITEIGGHGVQSPTDLDSALAGLHPGQQVQISYSRGPTSLSTEATLGKRPNGP